jgi:hypothetical protein
MKCGLFNSLNGVSSEIEEVGREQSVGLAVEVCAFATLV